MSITNCRTSWHVLEVENVCVNVAVCVQPADDAEGAINPSDVSPTGHHLKIQRLVTPVKEVLLAEAAHQKAATTTGEVETGCVCSSLVPALLSNTCQQKQRICKAESSSVLCV